MLPFDYARAGDAATAIDLARRTSDSRYLGGGTNLVDLMRETIERPGHLIDVTGLSHDIRELDGTVFIGAAATNTAVVEHRVIRDRFPLLARAILAGASAQIRNMATVGGNLLQRTRCYYFYDQAAARCNKRAPGTGCDARDGFNRIHAILGASDDCVATHPSDMCVALAALDAVVHIDGPHGMRTVPIVDFHRLPGNRPDMETVLRPGELITAIELPTASAGLNASYRKVRDRASYAFALVSVAAALDVVDGTVRGARIALGGVAHKPWRATVAEAELIGKPATADTFRAAARAELAAASPLEGNAFKVPLAERTIVAVLEELTA